ncbi:MAG: hypothetical protein V4487_00440, partial [Chlamydiota bacterium]
LIVTSSGGGGLIQAAKAKEQEALAKDPTLIVVRKDLIKDWLGKNFGGYCVNRWNQAQLKGDVADQTFCVWAQFFADYLFWPNIFLCALYTLFKEDVDLIIDTQPLGTSAICLALRIFNRKKGKKVLLEKILVDLPTKKAIHFFRPIKGLSKKNRPFLKLTTIAPLLDEGQTAAEFWKVNCGLSEQQINYEDVYVREQFRKFRQRARTEEPLTFKVRYKNKEELQLMRKSFERGSIQSKIEETQVEFQIRPDDRMITILLGSQPANEATLNYVKKFAQIAKEPNISRKKTHLFVFCADHEIGKETLYKKVADFVSKIKEYPKHFSIIPFSFQNEDVIAPLFFRSDLTCTRSGGQTAMELMSVSLGEMWIHSEAKKESSQKEISMEELLKGIPGWEAENAVYLQKIRGAKVLTPETFAPHARRLMREGESQAVPNRRLESTA